MSGCSLDLHFLFKLFLFFVVFNLFKTLLPILETLNTLIKNIPLFKILSIFTTLIKPSKYYFIPSNKNHVTTSQKGLGLKAAVLYL